jgi:hypothetical protein
MPDPWTITLQILMHLAKEVDNDALRSLLLAANCAYLVQYMGWVFVHLLWRCSPTFAASTL